MSQIDNDEIIYIQRMLKQKRFKNMDELKKFILQTEYEDLQKDKRRKAKPFIPTREEFVPEVPQHERGD